MQKASIEMEDSERRDGPMHTRQEGDDVLDRKANRIVIVVLFLFVIAQWCFPTAICQDPVSPQSLVFVVYFDGYVFVEYDLDVNQTYPAVNMTLFGEVFEDLLVVDEQELPVDFSQVNNTILVSSLGASHLKITYFTPDLTSKIGRIWTLATEVPINVTIELPLYASIVSLGGVVPELIESQDGIIILVMPHGPLEVSYLIEKQSFQPPPDYVIWTSVLILPVVIGIIIYWQMNKRKVGEEKKIRQVKVKDIFSEHTDLRQEEKEAIQFLAEKNGRAYEAELYERLNIPRTSTWRLIKRLEKMEIVDITKSRRQNIVTIRQQYLD